MFEEFNKVSLEQWQVKIVSDLKGKSHELLEKQDDIEGISFRSYYHHSEYSKKNDQPGRFPYHRGFNEPSNDWVNTAYILIEDDSAANKTAVSRLMSGATGLWFVQTGDTNWSKVLQGISFEHINTQFSVTSQEDRTTVLQLVDPNHMNRIRFNFDLIQEQSIFPDLSEQQFANYTINGFAVQQAGANTWQELAFCLNAGHESLLLLMKSGMSIDEASACIHFHVGVGNNYFFEIAKLRALKLLWSNIIDAYSPEHNCTYKSNITAVIGHMNKSLADPHTNLLRQTTESMSAISGSVDEIVILPYDLYASEGSSELAERMALNISLILKEESFFDKVTDPAGGSYSVEMATQAIASKAWEYFKEMESLGGLTTDECLDHFKSKVLQTAKIRTRKFQSGETVGIGMNKYTSDSKSSVIWKGSDSYLGLPALILEETIKNKLHES